MAKSVSEYWKRTQLCCETQLMRRLQFGEEERHGKSSHSVNTEPVLLKACGTPELISRNEFRQPM